METYLWSNFIIHALNCSIIKYILSIYFFTFFNILYITIFSKILPRNKILYDSKIFLKMTITRIMSIFTAIITLNTFFTIFFMFCTFYFWIKFFIAFFTHIYIIVAFYNIAIYIFSRITIIFRMSFSSTSITRFFFRKNKKLNKF